jgi:WXXGXW repeat (2 copies)
VLPPVLEWVMSRSFLALSSIGFLFVSLTACHRTQNQPVAETTGNPADGNLAPVSETAQDYAPGPPASQAEYPEAYYPPAGGVSEEPVEAPEPPPPLPEYTQPPCPGNDYIWTPGYWAWSNGYYWVPGAWVLAPWVGALWTPPWWGYQNNVYVWHAGYWGPHLGFYGGIDYGYGYPGRGYYGAYWNRGRVYYNREVTHISPVVTSNVYQAVVPRFHVSRASFNGGHGGIEARPTPQELAVRRDPRLAPVPAQVQHARQAAANRAQFAAAANGRPAALVAARPLPTHYRAPDQRPPETAVRAAARPTAEASRPAFSPAQPGRGPAAQPPAPPERAVNRAPEIRPGVQPRQGQAERTTPAPRPEMHAVAPPRPEPQARPQPQRIAPPRPQPQPRPEMHAVVPRPQPQPRPEMHAVAPPRRPAPQARPEAPRPPAFHPVPPEEKRKP